MVGPASGGQTRKRVCQPRSGRCAAAHGPNPPRTTANPRGMRGGGPQAGVKRASAFARCCCSHGPRTGNEHHTPTLRLALCHAARGTLEER